MSSLRAHRTAWAAALIFVLALGLRFGFWLELRGTALDRWHEWDQSDMATYLEQARRLEREDWLAAEPYHPYHSWQRIAPPEKWLEWYGPHAFHQAPGYAYALALARRLSADPLPWVKALQLVIGAVTPVLVFWLGTGLAGFAAGCVAGLLAAVYGPLFYLEPQILREGPGVALLVALLVALRAQLQRGDRPPLRSAAGCAALGVGLGVFVAFHEMASVMLAVASLALGVGFGRRGARPAALALAGLGAGVLVGFAPLLARNVAVGAPPFSVSCRTLVNFVEANEAGAPFGGAVFTVPGRNVPALLDAAGGSFPRALAGVWASYEGDVGLALRNWGKRFAYVWQPHEVADNTSYYLYRNLTRSLRALPTFQVLFPLGCAGALAVFGAAAAARVRGGRAPPGLDGALAVFRRDPAGHALMVLALLGVVAALSLVHTVARFRLYLVPFFWVYAGVFGVLAWRAVAARRPAPLAWLAALAGAAVVAQAAAESDRNPPRPRTTDHALAFDLAMAVDEPDFGTGVAVAEDALRHYPENAAFFATLGFHAERARDPARALAFYQRAASIDPDFAGVRQGIRRTRRAGRVR